MTASRYARALDDLFTYRMGDGPGGVPRLFIARSWIPAGAHGLETVAWLMNAMRLAEAIECSVIVRNILLGLAEDHEDQTINLDEAQGILDRLCHRVALLGYEDAGTILGDLGIPLNFVEYCHKCIEHIDVIPFTVETGFSNAIITNYSGWIPIGQQ